MSFVNSDDDDDDDDDVCPLFVLLFFSANECWHTTAKSVCVCVRVCERE